MIVSAVSGVSGFDLAGKKAAENILVQFLFTF